MAGMKMGLLNGLSSLTLIQVDGERDYDIVDFESGIETDSEDEMVY